MNITLWKNFRFTRFFASMTISNFGDWLDIFALQIIFVHDFHASPMTMGLLAFLYFIPAILLGPFAGVVADRYSKRNVMVITDILSAGLTIGLVLSQNTMIALIFILMRSSIASLNSPTQQAYIKLVVPTEKLLQASSYTTISFQLSKILGPILGERHHSLLSLFCRCIFLSKCGKLRACLLSIFMAANFPVHCTFYSRHWWWHRWRYL